MIFHQADNSLSNYNFNARTYETEGWEPHFHKNFELIYVLRGSVSCVVGGVEYELFPGEFGLVLPYEVHSYKPNDDTKYWVLVFSEDYVRYFSSACYGKRAAGFKFSVQPIVEGYVKNQLIDNSDVRIMVMKSCLYAVAEAFLSSVPLLDNDTPTDDISVLIADYVRENHRSKVTLEEIAHKFGYDYNYMSRYFRRVFDMTFTDFLNIYRLESAIELLEKTDKTITEIAYESGFGSVRNFNNFFCVKMKTSPTQYRKRSAR